MAISPPVPPRNWPGPPKSTAAAAEEIADGEGALDRLDIGHTTDGVGDFAAEISTPSAKARARPRTGERLGQDADGIAAGAGSRRI